MLGFALAHAALCVAVAGTGLVAIARDAKRPNQGAPLRAASESWMNDVGVPVGVAPPPPDQVDEQPPEVAAPEPTGNAVQVAEGDNDAGHWMFTAQDSNVGICLTIEGANFGGGSCEAALSPERGVSVSFTGPDPLMVYGMAAYTVHKVRVELDGGNAVETQPVGAGTGFGFAFYVVTAPSGSRVTSVVAMDASAGELERVPFQP